MASFAECQCHGTTTCLGARIRICVACVFGFTWTTARSGPSAPSSGKAFSQRMSSARRLTGHLEASGQPGGGAPVVCANEKAVAAKRAAVTIEILSELMLASWMNGAAGIQSGRSAQRCAGVSRAGCSCCGGTRCPGRTCLDLGEPPVDRVPVGLSNPAGAVVRIEEVDVDAASAVGLERLEEAPRPNALGLRALAGFFRQ